MGTRVTNHTNMQRYTIPKRRWSTNVEGNRHPVEVGTRDEAEIFDIVKQSCSDDATIPRFWKVRDTTLVRNTKWQQNFQSKRQELKEIMNNPRRDLHDAYAFGLVRKDTLADDVCEYGTFAAQELHEPLGDLDKGVNLSLHADVLMSWARKKQYTNPSLIIYKILKGRVKVLKKRVMTEGELIYPSINHECHVLRETDAKDELENRMINSQIFVYEFDDDECLPTKHPRHCLPYAVICFERDTSLASDARKQSNEPVTSKQWLEHVQKNVKLETLLVKDLELSDDISSDDSSIDTNEVPSTDAVMAGGHRGSANNFVDRSADSKSLSYNCDKQGTSTGIASSKQGETVESEAYVKAGILLQDLELSDDVSSDDSSLDLHQSASWITDAINKCKAAGSREGMNLPEPASDGSSSAHVATSKAVKSEHSDTKNSKPETLSKKRHSSSSTEEHNDNLSEQDIEMQSDIEANQDDDSTVDNEMGDDDQDHKNSDANNASSDSDPASDDDISSQVKSRADEESSSYSDVSSDSSSDESGHDDCERQVITESGHRGLETDSHADESKKENASDEANEHVSSKESSEPESSKDGDTSGEESDGDNSEQDMQTESAQPMSDRNVNDSVSDNKNLSADKSLVDKSVLDDSDSESHENASDEENEHDVSSKESSEPESSNYGDTSGEESDGDDSKQDIQTESVQPLSDRYVNESVSDNENASDDNSLIDKSVKQDSDSESHENASDEENEHVSSKESSEPESSKDGDTSGEESVGDNSEQDMQTESAQPMSDRNVNDSVSDNKNLSDDKSLVDKSVLDDSDSESHENASDEENAHDVSSKESCELESSNYGDTPGEESDVDDSEQDMQTESVQPLNDRYVNDSVSDNKNASPDKSLLDKSVQQDSDSDSHENVSDEENEHVPCKESSESESSKDGDTSGEESDGDDSEQDMQTESVQPLSDRYVNGSVSDNENASPDKSLVDKSVQEDSDSESHENASDEENEHVSCKESSESESSKDGDTSWEESDGDDSEQDMQTESVQPLSDRYVNDSVSDNGNASDDNKSVQRNFDLESHKDSDIGEESEGDAREKEHESLGMPGGNSDLQSLKNDELLGEESGGDPSSEEDMQTESVNDLQKEENKFRDQYASDNDGDIKNASVDNNMSSDDESDEQDSDLESKDSSGEESESDTREQEQESHRENSEIRSCKDSDPSGEESGVDASEQDMQSECLNDLQEKTLRDQCANDNDYDNKDASDDNNMSRDELDDQDSDSESRDSSGEESESDTDEQEQESPREDSETRSPKDVDALGEESDGNVSEQDMQSECLNDQENPLRDQCANDNDYDNKHAGEDNNVSSDDESDEQDSDSESKDSSGEESESDTREQEQESPREDSETRSPKDVDALGEESDGNVSEQDMQSECLNDQENPLRDQCANDNDYDNKHAGEDNNVSSDDESDEQDSDSESKDSSGEESESDTREQEQESPREDSETRSPKDGDALGDESNGNVSEQDMQSECLNDQENPLRDQCAKDNDYDNKHAGEDNNVSSDYESDEQDSDSESKDSSGEESEGDAREQEQESPREDSETRLPKDGDALGEESNGNVFEQDMQSECLNDQENPLRDQCTNDNACDKNAIDDNMSRVESDEQDSDSESKDSSGEESESDGREQEQESPKEISEIRSSKDDDPSGEESRGDVSEKDMQSESDLQKEDPLRDQYANDNAYMCDNKDASDDNNMSCVDESDEKDSSGEESEDDVREQAHESPRENSEIESSNDGDSSGEESDRDASEQDMESEGLHDHQQEDSLRDKCASDNAYENKNASDDNNISDDESDEQDSASLSHKDSNEESEEDAREFDMQSESDTHKQELNGHIAAFADDNGSDNKDASGDNNMSVDEIDERDSDSESNASNTSGEDPEGHAREEEHGSPRENSEIESLKDSDPSGEESDGDASEQDMQSESLNDLQQEDLLRDQCANDNVHDNKNASDDNNISADESDEQDSASASHKDSNGHEHDMQSESDTHEQEQNGQISSFADDNESASHKNNMPSSVTSDKQNSDSESHEDKGDESEEAGDQEQSQIYERAVIGNGSDSELALDGHGYLSFGYESQMQETFESSNYNDVSSACAESADAQSLRGDLKDVSDYMDNETSPNPKNISAKDSLDGSCKENTEVQSEDAPAKEDFNINNNDSHFRSFEDVEAHAETESLKRVFLETTRESETKATQDMQCDEERKVKSSKRRMSRKKRDEQASKWKSQLAGNDADTSDFDMSWHKHDKDADTLDRDMYEPKDSEPRTAKRRIQKRKNRKKKRMSKDESRSLCVEESGTASVLESVRKTLKHRKRIPLSEKTGNEKQPGDYNNKVTVDLSEEDIFSNSRIELPEHNEQGSDIAAVAEKPRHRTESRNTRRGNKFHIRNFIKCDSEQSQLDSCSDKSEIEHVIGMRSRDTGTESNEKNISSRSPENAQSVLNESDHGSPCTGPSATGDSQSVSAELPPLSHLNALADDKKEKLERELQEKMLKLKKYKLNNSRARVMKSDYASDASPKHIAQPSSNASLKSLADLKSISTQSDYDESDIHERTNGFLKEDSKESDNCDPDREARDSIVHKIGLQGTEPNLEKREHSGKSTDILSICASQSDVGDLLSDSVGLVSDFDYTRNKSDRSLEYNSVSKKTATTCSPPAGSIVAQQDSTNDIKRNVNSCESAENRGDGPATSALDDQSDCSGVAFSPYNTDGNATIANTENGDESDDSDFEIVVPEEGFMSPLSDGGNKESGQVGSKERPLVPHSELPISKRSKHSDISDKNSEVANRPPCLLDLSIPPIEKENRPVRHPNHGVSVREHARRRERHEREHFDQRGWGHKNQSHKPGSWRGHDRSTERVRGRGRNRSNGYRGHEHTRHNKTRFGSNHQSRPQLPHHYNQRKYNAFSGDHIEHGRWNRRVREDQTWTNRQAHHFHDVRPVLFPMRDVIVTDYKHGIRNCSEYTNSEHYGREMAPNDTEQTVMSRGTFSPPISGESQPDPPLPLINKANPIDSMPIQQDWNYTTQKFVPPLPQEPPPLKPCLQSVDLTPVNMDIDTDEGKQETSGVRYDHGILNITPSLVFDYKHSKAALKLLDSHVSVVEEVPSPILQTESTSLNQATTASVGDLRSTQQNESRDEDRIDAIRCLQEVIENPNNPILTGALEMISKLINREKSIKSGLVQQSAPMRYSSTKSTKDRAAHPRSPTKPESEACLPPALPNQSAQYKPPPSADKSIFALIPLEVTPALPNDTQPVDPRPAIESNLDSEVSKAELFCASNQPKTAHSEKCVPRILSADATSRARCSRPPQFRQTKQMERKAKQSRNQNQCDRNKCIRDVIPSTPASPDPEKPVRGSTVTQVLLDHGTSLQHKLDKKEKGVPDNKASDEQPSDPRPTMSALYAVKSNVEKMASGMDELPREPNQQKVSGKGKNLPQIQSVRTTSTVINSRHPLSIQTKLVKRKPEQLSNKDHHKSRKSGNDVIPWTPASPDPEKPARDSSVAEVDQSTVPCRPTSLQNRFEKKAKGGADVETSIDNRLVEITSSKPYTVGRAPRQSRSPYVKDVNKCTRTVPNTSGEHMTRTPKRKVTATKTKDTAAKEDTKPQSTDTMIRKPSDLRFSIENMKRAKKASEEKSSSHLDASHISQELILDHQATRSVDHKPTRSGTVRDAEKIESRTVTVQPELLKRSFINESASGTKLTPTRRVRKTKANTSDGSTLQSRLGATGNSKELIVDQKATTSKDTSGEDKTNSHVKKSVKSNPVTGHKELQQKSATTASSRNRCTTADKTTAVRRVRDDSKRNTEVSTSINEPVETTTPVMKELKQQTDGHLKSHAKGEKRKSDDCRQVVSKKRVADETRETGHKKLHQKYSKELIVDQTATSSSDTSDKDKINSHAQKSTQSKTVTGHKELHQKSATTASLGDKALGKTAVQRGRDDSERKTKVPTSRNEPAETTTPGMKGLKQQPDRHLKYHARGEKRKSHDLRQVSSNKRVAGRTREGNSTVNGSEEPETDSDTLQLEISQIKERLAEINREENAVKTDRIVATNNEPVLGRHHQGQQSRQMRMAERHVQEESEGHAHRMIQQQRRQQISMADMAERQFQRETEGHPRQSIQQHDRRHPRHYDDHRIPDDDYRPERWGDWGHPNDGWREGRHERGGHRFRGASRRPRGRGRRGHFRGHRNTHENYHRRDWDSQRDVPFEDHHHDNFNYW